MRDRLSTQASAYELTEHAPTQMRRRMHVLVVIPLMLVLWLAMPSPASAEPLCTDTWVGPGEGSWTTAVDWSTGKVPNSTDVACIGSGKDVSVSEGTNVVSVVQGEGTLSITGGSLEVANALEPSTIKAFRLNNATLTGAGTLSVSGSFEWTNGGTMSGSGKTIVTSNLSGNQITGSPLLTERTFVDEGTILFGGVGNTLSMSEGARLENKGTFKANSVKINVASGTKVAPLIVNTGTFEQTESGGTNVAVSFENHGIATALNGSLAFSDGGSSNSAGEWSSVDFSAGVFTVSGGTWASEIAVDGEHANVTAESVQSKNAAIKLESGGTLGVSGTMTASSFRSDKSTLTGAGTLSVSGSFEWTNGGTMSGSGKTVIVSNLSGNQITGQQLLTERTLVNEGTVVLGGRSTISMSEGARLENPGTFKANTVNASEGIKVASSSKVTPLIVNKGTFEKTEEGATTVSVLFENLGIISQTSFAHLYITNPLLREPEGQFGSENASALAEIRASCGKPVDCVTGNESEQQTDVVVGGRGVGLDLTRTYNAQPAAKAASAGTFGYGWSSSFSDRLVVESANHKATVYQANGSTVAFTEEGGSFVAPSWSGDTLTGSSEAGYTLTLADQMKYVFDGSNGRLESESDRNGNQTTLSYNEKGQLATITDPAGRKIKLVYNAGGQVETAEDPMGHIVKYAYEGGNLTSVTLPGETNPNWRFKYDASHRMTAMINGLGGETTNVYDASNRVTSQKDPLGHVLKFEYEGFQTKITNEATGAVMVDQFNSADVITAITRGYGTGFATTKKIVYNERNEPTAITDGNGHTTGYEYNAAGDRIKLLTPEGHETVWTYNTTHDITSVTRPNGEKTTITRDEHGNPTLISRPAPKETTQETKFEYNTAGEPTSMTDPLGRQWAYEYDAKGDRTSETDPEGDKRTWTYNEDSQQTSTVSPRGNVTGGEPVKYTTSTERDAQGRPVKITDPLGHETHYGYDADGNRTSAKDANGHETKTTYNLANEATKVTEASGAIVETEYDGSGQVVAQIDGNKHVTKYVRNVLEQVTEIVDPLLRKTTKTYDLAGNLATLTDAAKRTTTYTHSKDNQLTKVSYSDGVTPTVEYGYDANGNRTSMTDGTGKTTYTYDQLDRLTKTEDGHGDIVGYEYDLANEQTKITYPNGKIVEHTYDKVGRMTAVKSWLEPIVTFEYNADSDLEWERFKSGTVGVSLLGNYDSADRLESQDLYRITKLVDTIPAKFVYSRDNNGQVVKVVSKGVPGPEVTEYAYDENERLSKAATNTYEYDSADNPVKLAGITNTFDAANEVLKAGGTQYGYDEEGERTHVAPASGPATSYGYDQTGDLTSVSRPAEGETPKIEDGYSYNGDGLRTSETISGKTNYLIWDASSQLPTILSDGTNNYIYGPNGLPIEQINSEGKVLMLYHDQQGSTRVITGSTGVVEGAYTYTPYGTVEGHSGTATAPLGYDGQYTSADTGLLYLRARSYDPGTAQFMSVDPLVGWTHEQYTYADDSPLTYGDPSGLFPWEALAEGVGVGASCLLGPEVCVGVGLAVIDWHVASADVKSIETGCSPWPSIVPALVAGGVSTLPFGGGLVAKDVWEASRAAFRIGATGGIVSGGLAGAAAAANQKEGCEC